MKEEEKKKIKTCVQLKDDPLRTLGCRNLPAGATGGRSLNYGPQARGLPGPGLGAFQPGHTVPSGHCPGRP